ncbi:MAG TPA: AI-2E family transporter [Bacteroidetes bacterium]|nr:AI-2E family transporter [Bacteroidota bacterium]
MKNIERSTIGLDSLAYIVIILAGIKISASIITPFLLSLFIVIIFKPFSDSLINKGIPRWLTFTIISIIVLLFGFLVVTIISVSVQSFSENLSFYNEKLNSYRDELVLLSRKLGISEKDQLTSILNPAKIMSFVAGALTNFSDILSNSILILLTVIFIFIETNIFPDKIKVITKDEKTLRYFHEINHQVNNYMMIKTVISAGTGIIIGIALALIRLDFAILWGLIAFLLNYIPNIGSLIAAIPPIILALIQFGIPGAIGVTVIFLVINFVIGNYIEPKVMGKGLGLSVLIVFLSLIFWGWLLGPVGMLLSVPITLVFKIIMQAQPQKRWIAVLLGDGSDISEL